MQAHKRSFLAKNCILPFLIKSFPLLLPSHNIASIIKQCSVFKVHRVLFSALHFACARCSASFSTIEFLFQETQWNLEISFAASVSFFIWWRVPGSNRWPPACKAGALPAELTPHMKKWWAKMDSNHRPHDYQSCALASWAIGPYPFQLPLLGTVPSKLNNVKTLTLCTDQ